MQDVKRGKDNNQEKEFKTSPCDPLSERHPPTESSTTPADSTPLSAVRQALAGCRLIHPRPSRLQRTARLRSSSRTQTVTQSNSVSNTWASWPHSSGSARPKDSGQHILSKPPPSARTTNGIDDYPHGSLSPTQAAPSGSNNRRSQ